MIPNGTGLAVVEPGVFATIQDHGRTGYRAFGVPQGGAFDRGSAGLANALLGNRWSDALVELTLIGGRFEALGPIALAISGAPLTATIRSVDGSERVFEAPVCFPLFPGDQLTMGRMPLGLRAYLAVLGGWQTSETLGSRSDEIPIRPGAVLPCLSSWTPVRRPEKVVHPFESVTDSPVRVIDGPDAGVLKGSPFDGSRIYQVDPRSNRMGLRLAGPPCDVVEDPERLSSPVATGAVQMAGGQPIVLGVACGTMGGYPHVAHVVSADLDRLAQARPGDAVRFLKVSLAEARRLDRDSRRRRRSQLLRVATAAGDRR